MLKILFIVDIVGETGRDCVKKILPEIKDSYDLIIANGENAAGGKGISKQVFEELLNTGIDVITLGNHTFARKEVQEIISHPQLVRPLNFPEGNPGVGSCVIKTEEEQPVAVINILGRVFTLDCLDCPFRSIDKILPEIYLKTKVIIVDFHAEATSEKLAMGYFLDGKVSAVVGTHSHVPTNDAQILPNGTGYITDVGMCGAENSIIGLNIEPVLKRFLLGTPHKFQVAKGSCQFNAVELYIDELTGKCVNIVPFVKKHIKV